MNTPDPQESTDRTKENASKGSRPAVKAASPSKPISAGFDKNNYVTKWIAVENETGAHVDSAQNIDRSLKTLSSALINRLRNDNGDTGQKILKAYAIMKEQGYKFEEFEKEDSRSKSSLIEHLQRKKLDTTSSTALILGVAQALGWKDVNIATANGQVVVRHKGMNYDLGMSRPDSYYVSNFNSTPVPNENDLGKEFLALAYVSRGLCFGEIAPSYNKHADKDLTQAIALSPKNAEFYYLRGENSSKIDAWERARGDYAQARLLNPKHALATYGQAMTYLNVENYNMASGYFKMAIDLNPKSELPYIGRATANYFQKRFADAKSDFATAMKINPQNPEGYLGLGTIYSVEGNPRLAIDEINKVINGVDPKFAKAYAIRASVYERAGNLAATVNEYSRAIDLEPTNAIYFFNRGAIKVRLKRDIEALVDFNSAIRLQPGFARAYFFRSEAKRALFDAAGADADLATYQRLTGKTTAPQ